MKGNGQTDCSTDDDRLSTGSYKGKSSKNSKQISYCSGCGELDHNASKYKVKHKLFCNFCNKRGHTVKACQHRMNVHDICVHCGIDHVTEPFYRSQLNNRENLRSSPSTSSGLPRPMSYNQSPRTPPRSYGFDVYPPPGGRTTGQGNYQHTRYPGLNEN